MKRIAVCCDGTWNRLDAEQPTNVVKVAESILPTGTDGTKQVIYYDEGVGTRTGPFLQRVEKYASGMFGWGLMEKVEAAYRFLVFNFEPGDQIFIFGFSRGAYTARSLAGLIRNCGVADQRYAGRAHEAIARYKSRDPRDHPDSDSICEMRAELCLSIYINDDELRWREEHIEGFDAAKCIKLSMAYLGVWDTVGALGVPKHLLVSGLFSKKYRFHDDRLSSSVLSARHALAVDERRRAYEPTLWANLDILNRSADPTVGGQRFQQVWFPGDHSSIGGGGRERGLASAALVWVIEGAQDAGLEFDVRAVKQFKTDIDHMAPVEPAQPEWYYTKAPRRGPDRAADVSEICRKRWHEDEGYRPKTLERVAPYIQEATAQ